MERQPGARRILQADATVHTKFVLQRMLSKRTETASWGALRILQADGTAHIKYPRGLSQKEQKSPAERFARFAGRGYT